MMQSRWERSLGGTEPGAVLKLDSVRTCSTGVGVMFSLSADWAKSGVT